MVLPRFNRPNRFAQQQSDLASQLAAAMQQFGSAGAQEPRAPLTVIYRSHEGIVAYGPRPDPDASGRQAASPQSELKLAEVRELIRLLRENGSFNENGRWSDRQGNNDPCFRGSLNGQDVVITNGVIRGLAIDEECAPQAARSQEEVPIIAALRAGSAGANPQPEASQPVARRTLGR